MDYYCFKFDLWFITMDVVSLGIDMLEFLLLVMLTEIKKFIYGIQ